MNRKAFTVVEGLVAVAIIGVLVALLLPAIHSARNTQKRAAERAPLDVATRVGVSEDGNFQVYEFVRRGKTYLVFKGTECISAYPVEPVTPEKP